MIGADAKDIVFTSGATESNNIAVKGVAHFYQERKKHIITTQIVSLLFILINSFKIFLNYLYVCICM